MIARRLAAALGALALVLTLAACAQLGGQGASHSPTLDRILSDGELVVGTAGNMPPLNMTTRAGDIVGFEVDLAKYIAYTMGVELRLEKVPFSELVSTLEAGKVDMVMSNLTITPQRNLKVAFAGPYFVSGKCVLTKQEALAAMESATDVDARGLSVTALEGSTSQAFVETMMPDARFVPSKDYDVGVSRVLGGEVDAMLADYPICLVTLARYPGQGLVSVITRLTYEPIGIALPANDALLLNYIENLLQGLAISGRLAELQNRWFTDGSWIQLLP